MKGIFSSKIAVGVLFAVCVGAFTAQADLLLYDGFATETDGQNRTPYLSTSATHALKDANATSDAWTTGFVSSKKWLNTSSVLYSFYNKGLSLPADFEDGIGDQFTARGGSAGFKSSGVPGSSSNGPRSKSRVTTATMPTSGKLYYRCLMNISSASYNSLKTTTWKYQGTGISSVTDTEADSYSNQDALKNKGIRIAFTSTASSSVAIYANIGGSATNVLSNISADTTYIVIVELDYDTGKAKIYASPISSYLKTFTWNVENFAVQSTARTSAMNVIFIDGSYETKDGYVMFDEIAVGTKLSDVAVVTPATAPQLGTISLTRSGAATYAVSAEVLENAADTVSWIADDGLNAPTTNSFATAVATNTTASGTISGLAAKTYQVSVLAENSGGSATKTAGVIYTGELALDAANTTDAVEYGLVAGGVTVSRATADPWPLTVNYTITGSAGTEGTTWVAPAPVTIPANATSATLSVVPLIDGNVTEDITITVTIAAGNYDVPSANTATLTLVNLAPPDGKKTWVATDNGLASDGDNWFPAGPPTASDHILFDGAFSTRRCTWDADATHTVASWEQTATYDASGVAGVIDFYTTYDDGDFPALAITGDCIVNGGTWTHKANSDAQVNRLSITVGGDFILAAGAEITASNKGYGQNKFPEGAAIGVHGGSVNNLSKVYGDFRHPIDIGAGGGSANMTGGGAIHIVVAGTATVNGNIYAQANKGSGTDTQLGAGGSIYIQAASVAGSGYISAAGYGDNDTRRLGAGGRIAVICTTATALDYDKSKFRCNGSIGGYGWSSGGGTIFVKTASQQHGTLIVANSAPKLSYVRWWPTKRGVTPIPVGESWELDSIEFRGQGILCVPEGTSLKVPLCGVSSTNGDRIGGILYEGGTLDFGSAPYTLTGNWTFCADAPYTFDGDVTVQGGANFGGFKLAGHYTNDFAKCDVTVNGDLTIANGGYASVELAGPSEANGNAECGGGLPMHGGQYAGQSGNKCYGSVFEPAYPGHFAQSGDHGSSSPGGGVLNLSVLGDMVVNGTVSANAVRSDSPSAAAGSINIVAKSLSGTGTITADGKPGGNVNSNQGYNGVGGRIAVRVTEQDVGETDIWTTFSARGIATNQVSSTSANNRNASAGTIYLQGKSDGEKGGTIYVKNQASYDTSNVATWLPAGTLGDDAKDFAKSKLVIADRGVVAVGTNNLAFASISIAENSKIDLNGKIVKVKKAYLDGGSLSAGEYTADNPAVTGYVVDSVGGGKLIVGGGFFVFIR